MEKDKTPEQEPEPYYLAARFATKQEAAVPYYAVQEMTKEGVSGYRFMRQWEEPSNKPWYVVVIGERPSERVHKKLQEALSMGEMTSLPEQGVRFLMLRRVTETVKGGSWVEKHYGEEGLGIHYTEIKFSRRPGGKRHKRRRH